MINIDYFRINERIRAQEVRVIDENGRNIGIKPISEALKIASEKGLDLVEIVPDANPPVAKIVDYSRFRYEQERKSRQERKKTKPGYLKEIRFRPNISSHDLEFKINHIREFLDKKYRVKITIMFMGREIEHRDQGYELFNKIKEKISDIAYIESEPNLDRNRLIAIVTPIKK